MQQNTFHVETLNWKWFQFLRSVNSDIFNKQFKLKNMIACVKEAFREQVVRKWNR